MRRTNAETVLPPAPGVLRLPEAGRGGRSSSHPVCDKTADKGGAPAVLLACGNPLRADDGVGWLIAEAAEQLLPPSRLRVIAAQQWTPEMAGEIAQAALAIFVDASAADEAGTIRVRPVGPPRSAKTGQIGGPQGESHGVEPGELLALAEQVCGHAPARAFLVTVGAESFHYGERISRTLQQAVPRAVRLVKDLIAAFAPEA